MTISCVEEHRTVRKEWPSDIFIAFIGERSFARSRMSFLQVKQVNGSVIQVFLWGTSQCVVDHNL